MNPAYDITRIAVFLFDAIVVCIVAGVLGLGFGYLLYRVEMKRRRRRGSR